MTNQAEDPLSIPLRPLIPLLVGFMDDALVVGLSRLGCTLPVLKVLSPLIIGCTVGYVIIQLCHQGMPLLKRRWKACPVAALKGLGPGVPVE